MKFINDCFNWMNQGMGGGMVFMWIFWILIIGLIISVVLKLVNPPLPYNQVAPESSMEILKKRYARGEISKEEFEQIKKDLE